MNISKLTIAALEKYLLVVIAYLVLNAARLGLDDEDDTRLADLVALYGNISTEGTYLYIKKQYDNMSGKDRIICRNLKSISNNITKKLSVLYDDIPASKWNNADRETLGRKTGDRSKPTHRESKITEPCVVIPESHPFALLKLGARQPDTEKKGYSLPDDVDGLEIRYAVVESAIRKIGEGTNPCVKKSCTGPNDGTSSVIYFKAKFELQLDDSLAGFDVVIFIRWTDTHDQQWAGEWVGPYTIRIH